MNRMDLGLATAASRDLGMWRVVAMTGVGFETRLLCNCDPGFWDGKQKGNRNRNPKCCDFTVTGGGEGFVVLPLFHQTRPTASS